MSSSNKIRVVSLSATLVFALATGVPALLPSPQIRFLIIIGYLIFAPGYLLSILLAPGPRARLYRFTAALVLGTVSVFILLKLIALTGADVASLRFLVPVVTVALAIFAPLPGPDIPGARQRPGGAVLADTLVVALSVIVSILMLVGGGDPVIWTTDSPDHIAWIRAVARSGEPFPEEFYYQDGGMITRDIRKGLLHALVGGADRLTAAPDALRAWNLTSWLGAMSLIAVMHHAGTVLLGSSGAGAVAVTLLVLADRGGLAGNALLYTATGFSFGLIFHIVFIALLPGIFERPQREALLLATAAVLASTGAHAALFILALFALGACWLSFLVTRDAARRRETLMQTIPLLALAITAANTPYLVMRFMRDYAPANPLHTHLQGVLFLPGGWQVLNPTVILSERGILAPLALAAILLLHGPSRRDASLRLLRHGLACWYLLAFVPLWFPAVSRLLTYLLIRMEAIVPAAILGAALVTESWRRLRGERSRLGAPAAICGLVLSALLVGPPIVRSVTRCAWLPAARAEYAAESALDLKELYHWIERALPDAGVILSDPITSYAIPAFTDQFAVCPLDQHSTPNDWTAMQRLSDCREVFMPAATPGRVAAIMERHGARYVLANGRIPEHLQTMYWRADSSSAAGLARRLGAAPSYFTTLWQGNGVSLHRLEGAPTDLSAAPLGPPVAKHLDRATASGLTASGIDGVVIARLETPPLPLRRGDEFKVIATWVALEEMPFDSYTGSLRFDTTFERGPLYRDAWSKPYRKMLEHLTGERYRFRRDFLPLSGIYPPDTWPVLAQVNDTVTVRIPLDVSPGRYSVSLRLFRRPHFPNYHLADLVRDEDIFAGEVISWITVE